MSAGIAQLVERDVANVKVAGSNPVSRSISLKKRFKNKETLLLKLKSLSELRRVLAIFENWEFNKLLVRNFSSRNNNEF